MDGVICIRESSWLMGGLSWVMDYEVLMMSARAFCTYTCPEPALGTLVLTVSDLGLCGLWFEGQQHFPSDATPGRRCHRTEQPVLQQACSQLDGYFALTAQAGAQPFAFELPLDLHQGTVFQQKVWLALLDIPIGTTVSYQDIARRIAQPRASRAVGAAVARNPISIVVPCHRVVGTRGALTGYAGGLARKNILLQREQGPAALGA
jgi:methylated-DNA-[protein]-cysteine S-methyltransferase